MSHVATKWAFDQPETYPDMKPSEWAVLIILADCHNPVAGCFPSQDYICRRTNLSERAVREQLARLTTRGLIVATPARENGKRGSNRYVLAFENASPQPARSAGSSTGNIQPSQPANSDTFNRQNLPPNLVIEPVTEPRAARASAFEGIEERKKGKLSPFDQRVAAGEVSIDPKAVSAELKARLQASGLDLALKPMPGSLGARR